MPIEGKQLLDVPTVLTPTGIELEEDEVGRFNDGDRLFAEQPGTVNHVTLPSVAADNDVHVPVAGNCNADDACERVLVIPHANINPASPAEIRPELRVEHAPVDHQQILIERGSAHTVDRQRGGANQCVRDLLRREKGRHTGKLRHGEPSWDRDGTRPIERAFRNAARASASPIW